MSGVLAHHTKDRVRFEAPLPLQSKGIDAYKKRWELFFSFQAKGGFELNELQITASDMVAFCHRFLRVGGEKKPQVRLTIGLCKVREKWLIAHEHYCAPIELEQGQ
jgi:ketosteroid isomerase-like protein